MDSAEKAKGNDLFVLVHGRYHNGEVWKFVQEHLKDQGIDSLAPTLDIGDTGKSLDDHANEVIEAVSEREPENVIMNGWSWGANVILRCTAELPVRQLQFTAPSLQAVSFARSERLKLPEVGEPPDENLRYSVTYRAWKEVEEKADLDELVQQMGRYMFYHDVEPARMREILVNFRRHPRHDGDEPELGDFPDDIAKVIYVPGRDKVLKPEWLEWQTKLLGATVKTYPNNGHSLMLAKPREFAKQIIRNAGSTSETS